MNSRNNRLPFFPISVWYSGGKARAPMLSDLTPESPRRWRRDLEQIHALGFRCVRTWVEWAHCEPQPGEYRFENLKLLCELAQEVELRVVIQMYVDSAPDWVGREYPDALFEAQSGEKVPSQAAPGFCLDHEGVARAVLDFYTASARIAAGYPNFFGWDLWSEPHVINWAIIKYVPNAQFCYCPHTQERFRQWLKTRYGELDALNRAWYRNFSSWDEVQPPRFGTILSYTDYIDWKSFIYAKLAEDLKSRHDAIRKADPRGVITSHAAVPSVFTSPRSGEGEADDFLMADQVDYYGTSLYPKHSFPHTHWERWKLLLAIDFSRSANLRNGGFHVGELQAGFGTRGLVVGDPVTAGDHRVWLGSALAGGAKGIHLYAYYPMASGYESGGYGLVHLDGKATERGSESGRIARMVDDNRTLFATSKPVKAEVAIVYNPLAQMIGGEQHCGPDNGLRDSLAGYWWALREQHIPVDFVHRRDLERDSAPDYKLILLPYPVLWTESAAEGLQRFVEAGGCAVAEARLGWNDERGYAAEVIPGMGLSEVFGVRETKVKMADEVPIRVEAASHRAMAGLEPGSLLRGAYFAESVEPLEGQPTQVLARLEDDSPILVASNHGQGCTLFIGSFLGLGYHRFRTEENRRWIVNLTAWAGIQRPFTSSHDGKPGLPVEIRLHECPGGWLLFLVNHEDRPEAVSVHLNTGWQGKYGWKELLDGAVGQAETQNQLLSGSWEVPAKNVRIVSIERCENE